MSTLMREPRTVASIIVRPDPSMRLEPASIGSWSHDEPVSGEGKPTPAWSGCPPEAPSPSRTPWIPRLATPELSPLATDFEFCHCHGNDVCEDRINDVWYLSSRARVDAQVEAALAHIARVNLDHASWE
ncbi:hypothetical protein VDGD_06192 [Verticillium dahliae]|nr:hypothetical protein VDGD_06192 [Verticillium dahliae]